MHRLGRSVRFSVNPFLDEDGVGFNSYCSKPAGEGLAIFFELFVELAGDIEPTTGLIVNVSDIDDCVRQWAVPVFAGRIRRDFKGGRHIGIVDLAGVLRLVWNKLADRFGKVKMNKLSLNLNPFRKITIDSEDDGMLYFSEKFEFAATHTLWNDDFSEEQNLKVFGRCANPAGHGHNYVVEVTIKVPAEDRGFCIGDFEEAVNNELIRVIDHKNLNADVSHFAKTNPTVENIAAFAFDKLNGRFGQAAVHCVTVWENDRTCCSCYGEQN